jgi:hypothetical protein
MTFKFRVPPGARTVSALVEAEAAWKDIALPATQAATLRRGWLRWEVT